MLRITIAKEFYASGEDNLKRHRYNAATDSFFKAMVTLCDHQLATIQGISPKNHTERFTLLQINYPKAYLLVSNLFSRYRKTYNQKADQEDAQTTKERFKDLVVQF